MKRLVFKIWKTTVKDALHNFLRAEIDDSFCPTNSLTQQIL